MSKQQIIIRVLVLIAVIGFLIFIGRSEKTPRAVLDTSNEVVTEENEVSETVDESESYPIDVRSATYSLGDRKVSLVNGTSVMPAAIDSPSEMKVSTLNGPAFADIDGDGKKDAVVVLRDEPGGSGVFYHLAVLLSNKGDQVSTNSVLLGDRIRIKSIEIMSKDLITVVTMERSITDPMTSTPNLEKIRMFQVSGQTLTEIK